MGTNTCYHPAMAVFDEVLAAIREHKGDEPLPEDVTTTLETEYRNVTTQLDGATLRLSERDESIVTHLSEIARLKGENYDLSIKVQGKPESEVVKVDPIRSGISGLFAKRS